MSARPHPAAAPLWVREVASGPARDVAVLHRGPDAVYLRVGDSAVGVLSRRAVAVPCGARSTLETLPREARQAAGASIGDGRIALGGVAFAVTRTVDYSAPSLTVHPFEARARLDRALGDRLSQARAELPVTTLDGLGAGDVRAVPALLGRGGGLTPLGDDVLAGWVATVVAVSGPSQDRTAKPLVDAVVRSATAATTLLSATLLLRAAHGDVLPELARVLTALDRPELLDTAVADLVAVGHSSGAGLALGTLLALTHLAARSRT